MEPDIFPKTVRDAFAASLIFSFYPLTFQPLDGLCWRQFKSKGGSSMFSDAQLAAMKVRAYLVIGVERALVTCLHIALSVPVFQAAKRPGKRWLYPAAILLHAGMDVFAALYQRGVLSIWLSEGLMAACSVPACALAFRLYRGDRTAEPV